MYLFGKLNVSPFFSFFFFNDTATTEIYTLSLHELFRSPRRRRARTPRSGARRRWSPPPRGDRKSTRLNSSLTVISYAVFCLKKTKIDCTRPRKPTDKTQKVSHVGNHPIT